MDNKIKKFQKAFIIFTIAQIFIILGLLEYGSQIKAISNWMELFIFAELIGCILMVISATMLVSYNKNYFYLFVTAIIEPFLIIISVIAGESVEDFTVAWGKGLTITTDVLLCLVYVYFFLGTRDYFSETDLAKNVNRSKVGFLVIVISTIAINLLNFVRTFSFVKTNYIVASILRYGTLALKFGMYTFIFVILLLIVINMQKKRKEKQLDVKEEQ